MNYMAIAGAATAAMRMHGCFPREKPNRSYQL